MILRQHEQLLTVTVKRENINPEKITLYIHRTLSEPFAPVRPLTQISLASARAFSIPLEKNPVQTLLTPFRDGQSEGREGGARRVSQEDREDEAWNRRILFSAIDIVRARSRIKLSRAGEMPLLFWLREVEYVNRLERRWFKWLTQPRD